MPNAVLNPKGSMSWTPPGVPPTAMRISPALARPNASYSSTRFCKTIRPMKSSPFSRMNWAIINLAISGSASRRSAILTLLGFGVLYWAFASGVAGQFGLPSGSGLGFDTHFDRPRPVLHLISPLTSFLSRRAEYQADGFAKAMAGPEPMISALTRLSRDNLSTLTPDRLYALFYYSHPPVPARIARLKGA